MIATVLAQAITELESQEPVVTVPRRLALNTWAFLAQDCSPCAHKECQIGLKNVGVDTLTDAWNKQLAGNTHPPQRTWVGLTEDERDHLAGLHLYAMKGQVEALIEGVDDFAKAIEAKLKELNT